MAARAYNKNTQSGGGFRPNEKPGTSEKPGRRAGLLDAHDTCRSRRRQAARPDGSRYFTLRFSADSLPRFATISYSIC